MTRRPGGSVCLCTQARVRVKWLFFILTEKLCRQHVIQSRQKSFKEP